MELVITEKKPTICLNMIVKNESHIIQNTLEKLCSKINFSYWVICDTGSTDNTKEIIREFFKNKNIHGELHCDEWVNFAHNRTIALSKAFSKTDLLLVFDADDEIVGDIQMPNQVNYDEYNLKFGSELGTSYVRCLLINNHKRFKYESVIHEYICCLEHTKAITIIQGNYYVISGRNGDRSRDPQKYLKDAQVLEAAHAVAIKTNDPLYKRYAFYCANSYKDHGDYENAIKWYKITLGQDNWEQEHYISCLRIYDCYIQLNQSEHGFFYLVKAFKYDQERLECLMHLLIHYCCCGQHTIAYNYYLNVKDYFENTYLTSNIDNKLFINIDVYNFRVPYYMVIIADKVKDFDCVVRMFEIIFIKKMKFFDMWYIKNLLFNLQFFIHHVKNEKKDQFIKLANEYIKFLYDHKMPLESCDYLENYNERFGLDVGYIFNKKNINIKFSKEDCKSSNNILIYTGFMNFLWNDTHVSTKSIGGAEKAVAYLCRYFPKKYNIIISGDVEDEKIDNISYINRNKLQKILENEKFHTIIISRYVSFFEIFKTFSCYQMFLSAHDSTGFINNYNKIPINTIIYNNRDLIDKVITLTSWHKNNVINAHPYLKDKMCIINNGILPHTFPLSNNKIKNKFVWTSCSYRGLHIMLNLWPHILQHLPDSTLDISSYDTFPKDKNDELMLEFMLKYDSIKHHGKLNTTDLNNLISNAEYWLYTNTFPETSCITGMEMLMSEVICLYYPLAGLLDTVGEYGIQVRQGNEIETLLSLTEDQKVLMRKKGKEYAMSCSWENRAKEWGKLLFEDENDVTIKFAQKISDNGSDADYCFKNKRCNIELKLPKNNILFYISKKFILNPLLDYFDSLKDKYEVTYTSDVNVLNEVSNTLILFIVTHFDIDIDIKSFLNNNNEIGFLNTEPLNLHFNLNNCIILHNTYPQLKFYDYSKSNLHILKNNDITNVEYLPYFKTEIENTYLTKKYNETKKIFDFGIIGNHSYTNTTIDTLTPRRKKIVKFLLQNGFSVNIINGFKNIRDDELCKCKYILNIHGQINENTNPTKDECSNIFEHIRCDRLLEAGYNILSEDSYCLDLEYIEKYKQNLQIINYDDFFNLEIYKNLKLLSTIEINKQRKIIDCFTFYNELEMLTYRLNVLNNVVDYFILVEANQTFTGKSKLLYFSENKNLYEKFKDKIIHIIVDLPFNNETINIKNNDQWANEIYQRNCISKGLNQIEITNNDLIIISDIDEIPDPKTLNALKFHQTDIGIKCLQQDFYYYNLESKNKQKFYFAKILSYKKYNELNTTCNNIRNTRCEIMPRGGWHLSYFGDVNFIKNKLVNFSHQEYNSDKYTNTENIQQKIDQCVDLFGRDSDIFEKIKIKDNTYLPPLYDVYLKKYYTVEYNN
jgi:beta-1,4-mannosyl-glycoprotein beta-1,4-N-acetylglucosaminyltransferase